MGAGARGAGSHASAGQASENQNAKSESEGMPAAVSMAIRRARVASRDADAKAHAAESFMNECKATATAKAQEAERCESEKDCAVKEALEKSKEVEDQTRNAKEAAAFASISKAKWTAAEDAKNQHKADHENDVERHNSKKIAVEAAILKLEAELAESEKSRDAAAAKAKESADAAEKSNAAYLDAKESEETSTQALKEANEALDQANLKKEKAIAECVVINDASQAAADAAEEAVAARTSAIEVVNQALNLRDKLWELHDAIKDFYASSSDLVEATHRGDGSCTLSAPACLVSDDGYRAQLHDVLVNFNSLVAVYSNLKELFPEAYEQVKVSEGPVETNAMGQVKLSCDPDMVLEDKAFKTGDWTEFNEKCGDGLWPALGLKKSRFPDQ